MGRPPVPTQRLRRNRVVTMVTDSELKKLHELAQSENESLSATVHEVLIRFLEAQDQAKNRSNQGKR